MDWLILFFVAAYFDGNFVGQFSQFGSNLIITLV